jgi:PAS domain-containing protein
MVGFLPGIVPSHRSSMNSATPFPGPELAAGENPRTTFRAIFEPAPGAVARCDPQAVSVEMNPAFERILNRGIASSRWLLRGEMVRPQDRDQTVLRLRDLLDSKCGSLGSRTPSATPVQEIKKESLL